MFPRGFSFPASGSSDLPISVDLSHFTDFSHSHLADFAHSHFSQPHAQAQAQAQAQAHSHSRAASHSHSHSLPSAHSLSHSQSQSSVHSNGPISHSNPLAFSHSVPPLPGSHSLSHSTSQSQAVQPMALPYSHSRSVSAAGALSNANSHFFSQFPSDFSSELVDEKAQFHFHSLGAAPDDDYQHFNFHSNQAFNLDHAAHAPALTQPHAAHAEADIHNDYHSGLSRLEGLDPHLESQILANIAPISRLLNALSKSVTANAPLLPSIPSGELSPQLPPPPSLQSDRFHSQLQRRLIEAETVVRSSLVQRSSSDGNLNQHHSAHNSPSSSVASSPALGSSRSKNRPGNISKLALKVLTQGTRSSGSDLDASTPTSSGRTSEVSSLSGHEGGLPYFRAFKRREELDDNEVPFGIYTRAERRSKILKYKEKKAARVWNKKILYACRKNFADNRPRVGGRFIKMKPSEAEAALDNAENGVADQPIEEQTNQAEIQAPQ